MQDLDARAIIYTVSHVVRTCICRVLLSDNVHRDTHETERMHACGSGLSFLASRVNVRVNVHAPSACALGVAHSKMHVKTRGNDPDIPGMAMTKKVALTTRVASFRRNGYDCSACRHSAVSAGHSLPLF